MTIWDGGWPDQSEPERESEWVESEGDMPFLADPGDWRLGPMSPEEKMFRDAIEDEDSEDDA